jgi:glutamine---fructose-6-phosphate transaminase (isomerizing)
MCGIYGYVGESADVGRDVLRALRRLEYRGYDSWGVAVPVNGSIQVTKKTGKIGDADVSFPNARIGFGHTRWATHGGVTDANAHPHLDCSGKIAIVHNGIIENFNDLAIGLRTKGHQLQSQTDSELVAHMLEDAWGGDRSDLGMGFASVLDQLHGMGAIIALDHATKSMLAAKVVSPLVIGRGTQGYTIASDALALCGAAEYVHYLEDDQFVVLTNGSVQLFARATMREITPVWQELGHAYIDIDLHGHAHFMSKEMAEQPAILRRLVETQRTPIREMAEAIHASYGTFFTGCGTAAFAGMTGSYLFSRIASRHVNFAVGSEFKYHEHFLTPQSLVIALSQSGETADVVDAMMSARGRDARLGAIVNVPRSTLDRMVDLRVYLEAGPEQCVLSTKAYTAKVATLLLLAHELAGTYRMGAELVLSAANALDSMLRPGWTARVQRVAKRVASAKSLFVVGRGLSYPSALEAALKIKEVSYIHAEGFAGGELKHGVIALIEQGTPCVVYAPCDETRSDMLSGAMELKARGAYLIGIGSQNDDVFDEFLPTPSVGDAAPIVNALPAQMLGYYAAVERGNDPDKPRNLAKSVTVK